MSDSDNLDRWQPDLADRMRKSLRVSGISVGAMAEHVGVSRETVSTWINGHHRPSVATLRVWAAVTGAPFDWLAHGSSERDTRGPALRAHRSRQRVLVGV